MTPINENSIIGRAEKVIFVEHNDLEVVAKIDTGADLSSLWASDIHETEAGLTFYLFGHQSPHFLNNEVTVPKGAYHMTRISNSFGQKEQRYVVKRKIKLQSKIINASFTLSDRSKKTYPILIGRRTIQGKFLVDVKRGEPLQDLENEKKSALKEELNPSVKQL